MNTLRFFTTIAILGVSFSVRALPASAQLDRAYHYEAIDVVMTMNPDSTIDVPNGVGLGVTVNEEALKSFTLAKVTLK